jgi:hypothetical protein
MYFSFNYLKLLRYCLKKIHQFIPDTRPDARACQKRSLLRGLRHLLPLQEGLSGEIFVSARSMPQQIRQRLKVSVLRKEAAFEIPFKHHADIEG